MFIGGTIWILTHGHMSTLIRVGAQQSCGLDTGDCRRSAKWHRGGSPFGRNLPDKYTAAIDAGRVSLLAGTILGPPVVPFYLFLCWDGSPSKMDYRKRVPLF